MWFDVLMLEHFYYQIFMLRSSNYIIFIALSSQLTTQANFSNVYAHLQRIWFYHYQILLPSTKGKKWEFYIITESDFHIIIYYFGYKKYKLMYVDLQSSMHRQKIMFFYVRISCSMPTRCPALNFLSYAQLLCVLYRLLICTRVQLFHLT